MKKLFSALFIVMMIALACTLVAGAADVYTPGTDGLYRIEYAVPSAADGTQFGMVVIEATGDEAFALNEATIRYIDQVGAADKKISFDAFAPMELQNKGTYKVYIGGGDLDEATLIGTLGEATDDPGDEPGTDPVVPAGVLGDIDGNGTVDLQDATYLFNYSQFPDFFPMTYTGNLDFVADGNIDIQDATYLFNYSQFPEFFPIS